MIKFCKIFICMKASQTYFLRVFISLLILCFHVDDDFQVLLFKCSSLVITSHFSLFLIPSPHPSSFFYVCSSYRFAFCVRGMDVRVFSGKWKWKVSRVRSFTAAACEQVRTQIPQKWISFKSNDDVWQWYFLWLETMMMRSKKEVAEKNRVSHHHRYYSTFLSLRSTFPIDQVGEAR